MMKKVSIEGALTELEESIKGDDKEVIDAKVQNLSEKAQVLAQKAQEKAGAEGSAEASSDASDDVVDADFEEVNEEK
jgi:molecular chaperone DnaK